jgi:hypothetical protein
VGKGGSVKLTGDRNQCGSCAEHFNSTFAFEKHRTGDFGKDRRCLSPEEMLAKGMSKNAAGFWISSAMPADVSRSRPMSEGEEVAFASMARAHGWIGY